MVQSPRNRRLKGSCLCGSIRYEVSDAFVFAANCHCSACRRATGAAFKPFARIHSKELLVTQGEGNFLTFGNNQASDERCKTCGSLLFSRVERGFVHVAMGTLVDSPSISPTDHIFVGSKASWFTIADDLPQHHGHVERAQPD